MRYCQKCGNALNDNAKFCGRCGEPCQIPDYNEIKPKKSGKKVGVIVAGVILLAVLIGGGVLAIKFLTGDEGGILKPKTQTVYKVSAIKTYDEELQLTMWEEYEYDENGKPKATYVHNPESGELQETLTRDWEYSYDSDGNLIKKTLYNEEGSLNQECEYDENGNIIKRTVMANESSIVTKYTYNDNNQFSSIRSEIDGDCYNYQKHIYDEKDVLTSIIYCDDEGNEEWETKITCRFDDDDNLISQTYEYGDDSYSRYEYTYDEHGNQLSESLYYSDTGFSMKTEWEYVELTVPADKNIMLY